MSPNMHPIEKCWRYMKQSCIFDYMKLKCAEQLWGIGGNSTRMDISERSGIDGQQCSISNTVGNLVIPKGRAALS
jgi:hypothetical protein